MTLSFVINGNHENINGNPLPYFRTTQQSAFSNGNLRYASWLEYVRRSFERTAGPGYLKILREAGKLDRHPITDKKIKGNVAATIYFAGENHGDPDNVVKGILDALFTNDKHIDVQTFHTCGNESGRVEVTVDVSVDN